MRTIQFTDPFTIIGIALIIIGIVLVVLPLVAQHIPSLENLPWIILWVHKGDNFYFATSPLLILISIISLVLHLIRR